MLVIALQCLVVLLIFASMLSMCFSFSSIKTLSCHYSLLVHLNFYIYAIFALRFISLRFMDWHFACSALKEEKIAARSAILPMLQAEEDERYYSMLSVIIIGVIFFPAFNVTLEVHGPWYYCRFVKEWKKYLEEEARIMKDVPGWKVGESVYNSGKWMPPATGELRPEVW